MSASTFGPQEVLVTFPPDGAVILTWPAPTEEDPKNRDAAILSRDSLGAGMISEAFRGVLLGRR